MILRLAAVFLFVAHAASASVSTVVLEFEEPVEIHDDDDPFEIDVDMGRTFTGIQSVSIRVQGEIGARSVWYCIGTQDYELFFSTRAIKAGFVEEVNRYRTLPNQPLEGTPYYPPMETLDEEFTFSDADLSFLESGRARLTVGPVDTGDDPCFENGPGAGGWFRWLDMIVTRIEVTVTSDTVVSDDAHSWGAVKRLYDGP